MSTDTPIMPPDALTALVELAHRWDSRVRLSYSERQFICCVLSRRGEIAHAYAQRKTVTEAVEAALDQLEEAEMRHLDFVDDHECAACHGSGGGPDLALRCWHCSGTGVRIG
jgi:hypothetical protein